MSMLYKTFLFVSDGEVKQARRFLHLNWLKLFKFCFSNFFLLIRRCSLTSLASTYTKLNWPKPKNQNSFFNNWFSNPSKPVFLNGTGFSVPILLISFLVQIIITRKKVLVQNKSNLLLKIILYNTWTLKLFTVNNIN